LCDDRLFACPPPLSPRLTKISHHPTVPPPPPPRAKPLTQTNTAPTTPLQLIVKLRPDSELSYDFFPKELPSIAAALKKDPNSIFISRQPVFGLQVHALVRLVACTRHEQQLCVRVREA
jgi:hypothetical protein